MKPRGDAEKLEWQQSPEAQLKSNKMVDTIKISELKSIVIARLRELHDDLNSQQERADSRISLLLIGQINGFDWLLLNLELAKLNLLSNNLKKDKL